jgi:hypothetical protein
LSHNLPIWMHGTWKVPLFVHPPRMPCLLLWTPLHDFSIFANFDNLQIFCSCNLH